MVINKVILYLSLDFKDYKQIDKQIPQGNTCAGVSF